MCEETDCTDSVELALTDVIMRLVDKFIIQERELVRLRQRVDELNTQSERLKMQGLSGRLRDED